MKPDNNAFAICGAILFAALGIGLVMTGSPTVQKMAVFALWFGGASQWLAQADLDRRVSRFFAYLGIGLAGLATGVSISN